GVYFAEIGTSRAGGGNATLYDLESVQVLRGPQGTLFGRNNTGGAVLITPAAPTDVLEGYVNGRLGDYALKDLEGAFNLPLGDKAALRLAGRVTERDGYFRSVATGQRSYDINNQNLRASLRWTPNDVFTSTTIATWLEADEAGSMLKPT
ncbi:TonB-dependent receptor, partial [Brevundimonas sp. P7753]|nr:TonB-dependent receptor [Brevundimonas sp. P7753]